VLAVVVGVVAGIVLTLHYVFQQMDRLDQLKEPAIYQPVHPLRANAHNAGTDRQQPSADQPDLHRGGRSVPATPPPGKDR